MNIDAKKLHELHVARVKLVAPDERFYEVEDAINYALSTYGRLYRRESNGGWHKVPMKYIRQECYEILTYTGHKTVSVNQLMVEVFFPKEEWVYLYNPNFCSLDTHRWRIENLYVLTSNEELVEVLQAKMEHRQPDLPKEKMGNRFINRLEPKGSINSYMHTTYFNIRSRTCNQKVKELHPQYVDTTMSDEWLSNPETFYQYLLDQQYTHSDKLVIDKDVLGYGTHNCYEPNRAALVPLYINNIFKSGDSKLGYSIQRMTYQDGSCKYKVPGHAFFFKEKKVKDLYFDSYADALVAGRKYKADYIRDIVSYEKELGFMPDYILDAMLKWADGCELGLVKIWEPDVNVLAEMGIF